MKSRTTDWGVSGRLAALAMVLACAAAPALSGCERKAEEPQAAKALLDRHVQGRVALVEFGLFDCALSDAGLVAMIHMDGVKEIPGLVYVRVENTQDAAAADAYYAAKPPGFAVIRDADAALAKAMDATAFPTFLLLDKFGHVRYRGPLPEDARLIDWAERLLAEKADPGPAAPQFGVTALAVQKLLDETQVPDLQGTVKPLRAYVGKGGLLVIFVDTSCPFAGQAIGETPTVAAVLGGHGVPSLMVNLAEPEDKVRAFYAGRATGATVLYDTSKTTQKNWQVDYVPMVLLLDGAGSVAYRGKAVWADLAPAAEKMLKLAPGSVKFTVKGTGFG